MIRINFELTNPSPLRLEILHSHETPIGVYYDMSNADYHSSVEMSRSKIMDFIKSPLYFYKKYIKDEPPVGNESAALKFGAAFHSLILEPEKFKEEDYGFKKNELEELYKMKESIEKDSLFYKMVNSPPCLIETSIYWIDDDSQVVCKCRPDILRPGLAIDLKTTRDISPRAFKYDVVSKGYDMQAAMIIDGISSLDKHGILTHYLESFLPINEFWITSVEKKTNLTMIYKLSEETIQNGRDKYKKALFEFKDCVEKDLWDKSNLRII